MNRLALFCCLIPFCSSTYIMSDDSSLTIRYEQPDAYLSTRDDRPFIPIRFDNPAIGALAIIVKAFGFKTSRERTQIHQNALAEFIAPFEAQNFVAEVNHIERCNPCSHLNVVTSDQYKEYRQWPASC